MKKTLIISYSHISVDPRVKKQIEALQQDYEIHTAAKSGIERIKHFDINYSLKFSLIRKIKRLSYYLTKNYEKIYWDNSKKQFLNKNNFDSYDLIIANDISALPLAFAIKQKHTKIYFDAHEYHPREFEDNLQWRLLHQGVINYMCKKYIPRVDIFTTVGEEIAKEYENFIGIKPIVIKNATKFQDIDVIKTEKYPIKFVHHGAAIPSRKLELMIDVFKNLPSEKYHLYFILVGDEKYIDKLKKYAQSNKNIYFEKAVKQDVLTQILNKFDLGIYILEPSNFNNLNALPNKLFDFIQARLGIVISPNPEMKNLVEKFNLGLVSDDYSVKSMIKTINQLNIDKVNQFKDWSDKVAYDLSSEKEIEKIRMIVNKILN